MTSEECGEIFKSGKLETENNRIEAALALARVFDVEGWTGVVAVLAKVIEKTTPGQLNP